jgi:hypothetical protein
MSLMVKSTLMTTTKNEKKQLQRVDQKVARASRVRRKLGRYAAQERETEDAIRMCRKGFPE